MARQSTRKGRPPSFPSSLRQGIVLSTLGKGYIVDVGGEEWLCRARGRIFQGNEPIVPVVGDRVLLQPGREKGRGIITEVDERRSTLSRRAPGTGSSRRQVLVANIDQVVLCHAVADPPFREGLVDRYLATVEGNNLRGLLLLNKIDLVSFEEGAALVAPYQQLGYPVLLTSARTGEGLEALCQHLASSCSVITGPSGAGKTSLLNQLQPGLRLRTSEVNEHTGRGRHTTTAALLVPFADGYLIDTPGIREFGLWGIEPDELPELFVEFRPFLYECRFRDCSHTAEPDCAIKEAVLAGQITEKRYQSYLRLREELLP